MDETAASALRTRTIMMDDARSNKRWLRRDDHHVQQRAREEGMIVGAGEEDGTRSSTTNEVPDESPRGIVA